MSYGSNNSQGGGTSIIPLIIGILIIVFLGVYFIYSEPVNNKFAIWAEELSEVFTQPSASTTPSIKENDKNTKKRKRSRKWPQTQSDRQGEDPSGNTGGNIDSDKINIQINEITGAGITGPQTDQTTLDTGLALPEKEPIQNEEPDNQPGYKFKAFRGENGKYGFKDISTGNIIIEPQYDGYTHPNERKKALYLAVRKGNKFGIIDFNNRIIVPFIYDWMDDPGYSNYWKVRKAKQGSGYLYGLIRVSDAKYALPAEYEEMQQIASSLIAVKKNGLYGCVNEKNEVVVPIIYKWKGGTVNVGRNDNTTRVEFHDAEGKRFSFNKNGQMVPD